MTMTVEHNAIAQGAVKNQETIINQLKEITGVHDPQALRHAFEASNGDISQAVAFLTDGVVNKETNMRPTQPTPTVASNAENRSRSNQNKPQGDVIDLTQDRDEDIQRAIAMSLQDNQHSGIHAGVTAEEQDISRALEQSIKDPSTGMRSGGWFVDPINPYERQRENSWPVGLKNVGNTCWFSAVIQSLYHLPTFRHMVLSFIPPRYLKNACEETENSKEHRNLLFMAELRALFALMLGTKRKYVDPTKPVEILKAAFSNGSVDDQQDVSEFTHKLLEWLEDAFKSDCSKNRTDPEGGEREVGHKRNPMLDLFYGQFKVEGINEGKTFVNTETFGQYPLRVQGFSNLHDSLEASTCHGEIETVNSESTGKSAQEQWFTRLPHVLTFELSRFQFNQALGRPEKIHNTFRFPQVLYMDRYMDENRLRVRAKREELQKLTTQMNDLQVKLDRFQCYGSGNKRFPLRDVLQYALDFATSQSPDNVSTPEDVEMVSPSRSPRLHTESRISPLPDSSQYSEGMTSSSPFEGMKSSVSPTPGLGPKHVSDDELMVLQQCLRRWRKEVEQDVNGLQDNIDRLRCEIDQIFDEEDLKKFEFRLHAVLVHEGQASAGHYWAYVLDHKRNVWLKFNDISVAEVTWEDLQRDSVGGSGNASAYCVMYVDSSRQELFQDFAMKSGSQESVLNHLAEDLKQLVLEDNERFHDELRQWDQEQIKRQRIPKNSQEMGIRTESRGTSIKGLPVGQESVHDNAMFQSSRSSTTYSAPRFSTEHSSMSVTASKQAISKSQDVFSTKGPEAALVKACEEEMERLQSLAKQEPSSPGHDVRLQSSIVYFIKNEAPLFVVERSVLEQFADKNLNYDVKSQAIRKLAERKVESQRLSEADKRRYQMWHDEYNVFTKCTAFFTFGVKELYKHENCQSALPYFVHACRLNDFFEETSEGKRQWPDLLWFCRRQCLLQLSEQCAAQLESGDTAEVEQGLEDMKELVVPCVAMLSTSTTQEDAMVVEDIRRKWCSFLGQDVSETVQDKLQDLLTRIIDTSSENPKIRPPPLLRSEKEDLENKFVEAVQLIKQNEPSAPI